MGPAPHYKAPKIKESKKNLKDYIKSLELLLTQMRTIFIEFENEHDNLNVKYAREVKSGQTCTAALREIR